MKTRKGINAVTNTTITPSMVVAIPGQAAIKGSMEALVDGVLPAERGTFGWKVPGLEREARLPLSCPFINSETQFSAYLNGIEGARLETYAAIMTTVDIQKRDFLRVNLLDGTYFA